MKELNLQIDQIWDGGQRIWNGPIQTIVVEVTAPRDRKSTQSLDNQLMFYGLKIRVTTTESWVLIRYILHGLSNKIEIEK